MSRSSEHGIPPTDGGKRIHIFSPIVCRESVSEIHLRPRTPQGSQRALPKKYVARRQNFRTCREAALFQNLPPGGTFQNLPPGGTFSESAARRHFSERCRLAADSGAAVSEGCRGRGVQAGFFGNSAAPRHIFLRGPDERITLSWAVNGSRKRFRGTHWARNCVPQETFSF